MSGQLDGKIAVITGSTQGLGAAVARLFVKEGARVVVSGRKEDKGRALIAELGDAAIFQRADLARVDDCRSLMATALNTFGGVDILINSAADTSRAKLESFTPEFFDAQVAVNLRAPLLLAQAALPSLRERKGVIVNIGSVNAYMGLPNLVIYSATKGALMTASRNMANAFKHARVRVFCLNVGWMETEGEYQVLAREGHTPDFIQREGRKLPSGRLIQPAEVADVCLYLASPRTQVFSGAVIELEQFPIGALDYASGDDPKS
jgi:NAD(P)-dependent dehydrogenase (short-subunit alcohol dehydrogenase family)